MKTIIAGSRSFRDYELLKKAIAASGFEIGCVVSGCARGADELGERWAKENGVRIETHPAEWSIHGKKAGILRNHKMGAVADALIAFWDGQSRGTRDMIATARARGLKVYVQMFTPAHASPPTPSAKPRGHGRG